MDVVYAFPTDMRIAKGGLYTIMPQQLLNVSYICAAFQQVGSITVPEAMNTAFLCNLCSAFGHCQHFLSRASAVPAPILPFKEVLLGFVLLIVYCLRVSNNTLLSGTIQSLFPLPCQMCSIFVWNQYQWMLSVEVHQMQKENL